MSWLLRRLALVQGHGAFDAPAPTDHRADEQDDDAQMRDEKAGVVALPGPPRERRAGEVDAKDGQPQVKPPRVVDVSAGDLGVEARFVERADDAGDDEHAQEHNGQLDRREELEERVALPHGPSAGSWWQRKEEAGRDVWSGAAAGAGMAESGREVTILGFKILSS